MRQQLVNVRLIYSLLVLSTINQASTVVTTTSITSMDKLTITGDHQTHQTSLHSRQHLIDKLTECNHSHFQRRQNQREIFQRARLPSLHRSSRKELHYTLFVRITGGRNGKVQNEDVPHVDSGIAILGDSSWLWPGLDRLRWEHKRNEEIKSYLSPLGRYGSREGADFHPPFAIELLLWFKGRETRLVMRRVGT